MTTQIQGAAESLNDRHGLTSALRNAVVLRALTRFGVYEIQSIGASLSGRRTKPSEIETVSELCQIPP